MSTTASFSAEPMKQLNFDVSQADSRVKNGNEAQSYASQVADEKTLAWKQEVNQRLAAHRTRRKSIRNEVIEDATKLAVTPRSARGRAAEAAARVAERYAKVPSYSQWLDGEARATAASATEEAHIQQSAAVPTAPESNGVQSVSGTTAAVAGDRTEGQPDARLETQSFAASELPWQCQDPAPLSNASVEPRSIFDDWSDMQLRPIENSSSFSSASDANPAVADDFCENTEVSRRVDDFDAEFDSNRNYENSFHLRGHRDGHAEQFDPLSTDPLEIAIVEPVQSIPANLIEFPRELIAPHKARPRLAEGPFWEPSQTDPQLNIFEVDPQAVTPLHLSDGAIQGTIQGTITGTDQVAPPEWASIELDHPDLPGDAISDDLNVYSLLSGPEKTAALHFETESFTRPVLKNPNYPLAQLIRRQDSETVSSVEVPGSGDSIPTLIACQSETLRDIPIVADRESELIRGEVDHAAADGTICHNLNSSVEPDQDLPVASLSDRLLATVVDAALVTLAFLAAAVVVIAATPHPPAGRIALIASMCGLLLFGVLYQLLFLSLAEGGTPGMRYAKIALCNFEDSNPTLDQMVKRIPALFLSILPLGLGFAWAFFDGDHLAWHDRLTQTYQRKY